MQFAVRLPEGAGLVTMEVYEEAERMICAIDQIDGWLNLQPKAWLKAMRTELTKIEDIAKSAGCVEMRFAGRFSQKMFPDYEPYEPALSENGLRKVL
jgi:hypothetical protein